MADLITVKSGRDDNRVALFEQDAAHPGGEAFVTKSGGAVKVARTALVRRKLKDGVLVEVGQKPASAPVTPPPKPTPPWPEYDALTVDEVVAKLPDLDDAGRAAVLAYEQGKGDRGRKTIISTLVNWNSGAG